jgi:hypothetical protein
MDEIEEFQGANLSQEQDKNHKSLVDQVVRVSQSSLDPFRLGPPSRKNLKEREISQAVIAAQNLSLPALSCGILVGIYKHVLSLVHHIYCSDSFLDFSILKINDYFQPSKLTLASSSKRILFLASSSSADI